MTLSSHTNYAIKKVGKSFNNFPTQCRKAIFFIFFLFLFIILIFKLDFKNYYAFLHQQYSPELVEEVGGVVLLGEQTPFFAKLP